MGWTHGQRWQDWEIDLLKGDKQTKEIADITKRKVSVVNSARCRFKKRKAFTNGYRGPNYQGNSVRDKSYPGPENWTTDNGPPCLLCIYQHCKIDDDYGKMFRAECRLCSARIAWDDHNSDKSKRQSGEYIDAIADHYQCEEFEVGF